MSEESNNTVQFQEEAVAAEPELKTPPTLVAAETPVEILAAKAEVLANDMNQLMSSIQGLEQQLFIGEARIEELKFVYETLQEARDKIIQELVELG